ncbi:thiol-disulfide oxidoreductase DCC family protein [Aestuariirhabdus litorea]|uniref:DUF393 domain-containing protein n=1 Tax=Aestuariirhabdus litorea TaxID=2528527 RepID=A0A3P3VMC8_9GAMM|nr:DUF393 domain-containing protein [Aestuariirhabdus litorea]RRJ83845.1 DUF393 domain-containing protein [Aestuariirhabdus litorea]RWW97068.1 DUF393 domain-containing protein [Endozoicomonadaceae bacterium GTF-13]
MHNPIELSIYFDSRCPLCVIEMRALKARDTAGRILLVDIHAEGFSEHHPQVDATRASEILHGIKADGTLLLGLDVSAYAWSLVGRKPWLRWLRRWPLRGPSNLAYKLFARYRYGISRWLTGRAYCGVCEQSVCPSASRRSASRER